ncbi:hypothetical protein GW17_00027776 [Ensete ventricosum]|nr:hypothetical protein GW17_00027776 [Ensete ventricosum]
MPCDATKATGPKCARIVGLKSHLNMNCMRKGVIEVLATPHESLPLKVSPTPLKNFCEEATSPRSLSSKADTRRRSILFFSLSPKGTLPSTSPKAPFFEPPNEASLRAVALNLLPHARGRSPVMLPTPVDSGNQEPVRGGGRGNLGYMVFQLEALRPRSLGLGLRSSMFGFLGAELDLVV